MAIEVYVKMQVFNYDKINWIFAVMIVDIKNALINSIYQVYSNNNLFELVITYWEQYITLIKDRLIEQGNILYKSINKEPFHETLLVIYENN